MNVKMWKRVFGFCLLFILLYLPIHPSFQTYIQLSDPVNHLNVTGESITAHTNNKEEMYVVTNDKQIPIKKVKSNRGNRPEVIPGGQSIGIEVETDGVTVVGFHKLDNGTKESRSPAHDAGLQVGDVITKLQGTKVQSVKDVQQILDGYDKPSISAEVKRGNETKTISIDLTKAQKQQLGIYIKDRATGIGTLSFYMPETGEYGALGHIISDNDTKKPIMLKKGKLVRSSVKSIEKGNKGLPGEKQASFVIENDPIGTITKNSPYGIYGLLNQQGMEQIGNKQPIPIAYDHEIEKGPAEIYTVIDKEKVETFDVEIVQVKGQNHRATKGIILRVTDQKLLDATGGIVQGMSGSPIIQNGKIIGAVTHVFVNDPTTGYGVQIEWMLEELEMNEGKYAKAS